MEVADIYREIGRTLHTLGADRVVLVNAKAAPGTSYEMSLEIAIDGTVNFNEAVKVCREKWDGIQITLLDMNDDANIELLQEIIEDGIQI